jgi:riboflavin kinase / FMN adenylyltransferase
MIQKLSKREKTINIIGQVVKGKQYGTALGFPTANLDRRDYQRRNLKIRFGVYAGYAIIEDRLLGQPLPPHCKRPSPPKIGGELKGWYKAGIVIGPLDKKYLPKIEAHLIGFKGNLYGKYLNIYLYKYLRPFRKFKDEKDLKQQIARDIKQIKNLIL